MSDYNHSTTTAGPRKSDPPATPAPLPVRPDGIPELLKSVDRWVCWRLESRGCETCKPPYNARTGTKADVTDPANWSSFAKAYAAYERGAYSGVGFCFGTGGPFFGVDLDGCRDPRSGRFEPWAADLVRELGTYGEVSPSGTGAKLIGLGNYANKPNIKKGPVEVFLSNKYFTLTGWRLPEAPTTVGPREKELVDLYDSLCGLGARREAASAFVRPRPVGVPVRTYQRKDKSVAWYEPWWTGLKDQVVLSKARCCSTGLAFQKLYYNTLGGWKVERAYQRVNKETGAVEPDHSAADFALVRKLAFFTGPNPAQIDTLFRGSALMRSKWDDSRGRKTYAELTIDQVIGSMIDQNQGFYKYGGKHPAENYGAVGA
jgi:primase-polymerase (primpol)-like protein